MLTANMLVANMAVANACLARPRRYLGFGLTMLVANMSPTSMLIASVVVVLINLTSGAWTFVASHSVVYMFVGKLTFGSMSFASKSVAYIYVASVCRQERSRPRTQHVSCQHMATSRLLSVIEVVEGGPRADEVDVAENTTI